jgi:hypothetical protein
MAHFGQYIIYKIISNEVPRPGAVRLPGNMAGEATRGRTAFCDMETIG